MLFLALCLDVSAQVEFVRDCGQKAFPKTVPAGNYSGIAHVGDNKYAVVSDKSAADGFFIFSIDIDTVSGELLSVVCDTFVCDSLRGGDCEAIAYKPDDAAFFVCREADAGIVEYDSLGRLTGRRLDVPEVFLHGMGNSGFESLAYDAETNLFWTVNESTLSCDGVQATSVNGVENRLRLQSFGGDLAPHSQYAYLMDAPRADSRSMAYAMGVSELLALGGGRLLVLEREFFVPKKKLGAFVQCKLYEICPTPEYAIPMDGTPIGDETMFLPKRLVYSFITRLRLFDRSIANYEGMCVGPTLTDGSVVVLLVSDSQDQYAGVLKDFFRTVVIRK